MMKPITLKDFKINARHIAELEWGSGGTTAYRTNRPGAYYYSCSAHGGYVVDSRALDPVERAVINRYVQPRNLNLYVQQAEAGDDLIVHVDYTDFDCRGRHTFRYKSNGHQTRWETLPVYIFEEDCDWCVLEKFTDIRAKGSIGMDGKPLTEEQRRVNIEGCFQRWHAEKEQKAVAQ